MIEIGFRIGRIIGGKAAGRWLPSAEPSQDFGQVTGFSEPDVRGPEAARRRSQRAPVMRNNENMAHEKYARIERERRFILAQFPSPATVVEVRRITDHYIEGTSLRLRKQSYSGGVTKFKLTQKLAAGGDGAQQGFITSMYLTQDEFQALAQLPARKLTKTRFSLPPFGVDVFDGRLQGLILAEAEFDSAVAAEALTIPSFVAGEVSADDRFTGGELVRASREQIQRWLLDYGIALTSL